MGDPANGRPAQRAALFLYVGGEAALGTWTYSLLIGTRGIDAETAGLWAALRAMFTIGRAGRALCCRVGVHRMVTGGSWAAGDRPLA